MADDVTVIVFWLSILVATSSAVDTITANQSIRDDGNSTIESDGGVFELGFFSPGNSKNRYLGIWYKKIATGTVVWVANRKIPLADNSGVLRVDGKGILVLANRKIPLISSPASRMVLNPNGTIQLLTRIDD